MLAVNSARGTCGGLNPGEPVCAGSATKSHNVGSGIDGSGSSNACSSIATDTGMSDATLIDDR
jgi:hypothetical protein